MDALRVYFIYCHILSTLGNIPNAFHENVLPPTLEQAPAAAQQSSSTQQPLIRLN